MKSSRRIPLVLVSLALVAACQPKSTAPDPAPLRRALTTSGVPAAKDALARGSSERLDRIRALATELAPSFVLPVIQDRVTQLGAALTTARASHAATLGDGIWLALASDGSVFASAGPGEVIPFSKPLQTHDGVRAALTSGIESSSSAAWPHDATTSALVDVVAVRVDGAVSGALVIVTPYAAESARLRDAVRRSGGLLAHAGACLRQGARLGCTDVPDVVQRAAAGEAFAGARANTADFNQARARGVLGSSAAEGGSPNVLVWSALRSSH